MVPPPFPQPVGGVGERGARRVGQPPRSATARAVGRAVCGTTRAPGPRTLPAKPPSARAVERTGGAGRVDPLEDQRVPDAVLLHREHLARRACPSVAASAPSRPASASRRQYAGWSARSTAPGVVGPGRVQPLDHHRASGSLGHQTLAPPGPPGSRLPARLGLPRRAHRRHPASPTPSGRRPVRVQPLSTSTRTAQASRMPASSTLTARVGHRQPRRDDDQARPVAGRSSTASTAPWSPPVTTQVQRRAPSGSAPRARPPPRRPRGPGCRGVGRSAAGSGHPPWCAPARGAGRPWTPRSSLPAAGRPRTRPCAPAARPSRRAAARRTGSRPGRADRRTPGRTAAGREPGRHPRRVRAARRPRSSGPSRRVRS